MWSTRPGLLIKPGKVSATSTCSLFAHSRVSCFSSLVVCFFVVLWWFGLVWLLLFGTSRKRLFQKQLLEGCLSFCMLERNLEVAAVCDLATVPGVFLHGWSRHVCRECTGHLVLHMNESPALRVRKQHKQTTKTNPQTPQTKKQKAKPQGR